MSSGCSFGWTPSVTIGSLDSTQEANVEKMKLAIALADGQTFDAEMRPEDEARWTELFSQRSAIDLTSSDDDLEGHAVSGDVFVDVEGHAIALRLPTPGDAA